jgi:hypothetical protein
MGFNPAASQKGRTGHMYFSKAVLITKKPKDVANKDAAFKRLGGGPSAKDSEVSKS